MSGFGSPSHREKKHRKRLLITGTSASALVLLLVVGAVATIYNSSSDPDTPSHTLHSSSKSVSAICDATDYKRTCESSLSRVVNSSSDDPKLLLEAAVAVIADEIGDAFAHSKLVTKLRSSHDPRIKGALEDCEQLYDDSKDELNKTMASIIAHGLEHLPKRSNELRSWLSAVMSYLETCVDGFPEGEEKGEMRKGMMAAKEMTSNALAIIHQTASFLSTVEIPGFSKRRLLEEHPVGSDGVPLWLSKGDRRVLKAAKWSKLKPNVTVAKDGSGDYATIGVALAAMPKKYKGRYVIYVKKGVYEETVMVTKTMVNVTMYGDGSQKTIVTGSKNFVDGTRTFQTATFVAQGEGFMAVAMGFRNTAGAAKHQAVALRVQSDKSVFLNCRMEGYQDTLYAQAHRQFYRSCVVAGTVDFIFGDSAAVFQNCLLVVRRPLDNQQTIVTAHGRLDRQETTGFVVQNCRIIPDPRLKSTPVPIRSYLARPWKEYSRLVTMETEIGSFIHPDGYLPWDGEFGLKTLVYNEYNNFGPGSNLTARVSWPGFRVINKEDALKYTAANFIDGGSWIRNTGAPVHLNLYH